MKCRSILYTITFLLLALLHPHPSHAHNGAVAIAVPVEGIVVDGDLSDWPQGMTRYSIELPESGVAPKDSVDFKASFRIGYNPEENALYVAVEVRDESVVKESKGEIDWDTQETCEIYFFADETDHLHPTQYFLRGQLLGVLERKLRKNEVEAAVNWDEDNYQYEWKIRIEEATNGKIQIHSDIVLGFDIALGDKDGEESASWYAWSKGNRKNRTPLNIGFAYLAVSEVTLDSLVIKILKKTIEKTQQNVSDIERFETRKSTIIQMISSAVPFSFAILHLFLFLFYSRLRENFIIHCY